jgi:effector-binding domain-containing protein
LPLEQRFALFGAMLESPKITQTDAQHTAVIHVTVPRNRIQEVMGPGLKELRATVAAQGIDIAGPWFTHHLKMDPEVFDFEIGLPVKTPVSASGRVRPGNLPAVKVARTVYRGAYEGLGAAWGQFMEWIKTHGHEPCPDLWEVYSAGPESSPDPANWRTELNRPLKD